MTWAILTLHIDERIKKGQQKMNGTSRKKFWKNYGENQLQLAYGETMTIIIEADWPNTCYGNTKLMLHE